MRQTFLFLGIIVLITACKPASDDNSGKVSSSTDGVDTVTVGNNDDKGVIIDSIHNNIAKYLAGEEILFVDNEHNVSPELWKEYENTVNKNWDIISKNRLQAMSTWQSDYLSSHITDTLQLFYPFSGPDFLHAYMLFPNANDYLFLANEKIGRIPNFSELSDSLNLVYLHNLDFLLRDIYKRSYFSTGSIVKDLGSEKTAGILPLFYVFLCRTGHEILNVERLMLDENGNLVNADNLPYDNNAYGSVRFFFKKKDESKVKTLTYVYCDLSNQGLNNNNSLVSFLENMSESNCLIKSTSYLMHFGEFSIVRDFILKKSQSLFQDDSGIPFRFVAKNYNQTVLFGTYADSHKEYSADIFQHDLMHAFKDGKLEVLDLPFSIDYHWSSKYQNYMLARKNQ